MYVLKIDLPTGVAFFTGKKRVIQGCESPGLTDVLDNARFFEDEEEAKKFCKMLIKKYDMEFYYTAFEAKDGEPYTQNDFLSGFSAEISKEIDAEEAENKVMAETDNGGVSGSSAEAELAADLAKFIVDEDTDVIGGESEPAVIADETEL